MAFKFVPGPYQPNSQFPRYVREELPKLPMEIKGWTSKTPNELLTKAITSPTFKIATKIASSPLAIGGVGGFLAANKLTELLGMGSWTKPRKAY